LSDNKNWMIGNDTSNNNEGCCVQDDEDRSPCCIYNYGNIHFFRDFIHFQIDFFVSIINISFWIFEIFMLDSLNYKYSWID
jgi:hypothetical protein